MKHFIISVTALLFTLFVNPLFSQDSANELFEKAKGTLKFPIQSFQQMIDIEKRSSGHVFDEQDSSLVFITDSATDVRAAYNGTVKILFEINDSYTLGTRYGDYYIIYSGLAKPNLQLGDTVQTGQLLGKLTRESTDDYFAFQFSVFRLRTSLDPLKWVRL